MNTSPSQSNADLVKQLKQELKELRLRVKELEKNEARFYQTEKAFSDSEKRYRELVNNLGDAIIVHDGRYFLFANPAAVKMTHLEKPEDIIGKPIIDFIHPDYKGIVTERVRQILDEGAVMPKYEERYVLPNGSEMDAEVTSVPITFQDKRCVLEIIRDVTERKKEEKHLQKRELKQRLLSEQLAKSNYIKDLLLDVICHDIKNPANIIGMMADMILKGQGNEKTFKVIKKSSDRLIKVTHDVSALANIFVNDTVNKEKLDLYTIINDVLEDFDEQLQNEAMDIEINIPPRMRIFANPIIEHVFVNYISNAIEYASHGKRIVIDASNRGGDIILRVMDFGYTIPEKNRSNLFDRQLRLEKNSQIGRGLGLSIVKRIADVHGGEAWVEPNKPRGNIFCLSIPGD